MKLSYLHVVFLLLGFFFCDFFDTNAEYSATATILKYR